MYLIFGIWTIAVGYLIIKALCGKKSSLDKKISEYKYRIEQIGYNITTNEVSIKDLEEERKILEEKICVLTVKKIIGFNQEYDRFENEISQKIKSMIIDNSFNDEMTDKIYRYLESHIDVERIRKTPLTTTSVVFPSFTTTVEEDDVEDDISEFSTHSEEILEEFDNQPIEGTETKETTTNTTNATTSNTSNTSTTTTTTEIEITPSEDILSDDDEENED